MEEDNIKTAIKTGELLERQSTTAKVPLVPHMPRIAPYLLLRDAAGNERVEVIRETVEHPTARRGLVQLADAPSFIEYVKRHGTVDTAIYATIDPCRFVAVLDEHPRYIEGSPIPLMPASWREFRASFVPALSKEWETWIGRNGSDNAFDSTTEFAYFIENNAPDIIKPSAAELMEMALNFKVSQATSYRAVQRLNDGHMDVQFVNEVNGTAQPGSVKIPEQFTIEIPLFMGLTAPPKEIEARFRYRLNGGQLRLWYDLVRPQRVIEDAFKDLFREVMDGTSKTVLVGTTD
jgi:uncharacterized protein YfdQ (DUF2303 family)